MIFEFCNLRYLDQKFETVFEKLKLHPQLAHCSIFLRIILHKYMY